MEDRKKLVQMANKIQDALRELKHRRYSELIRQLMSLNNHLHQLTKEKPVTHLYCCGNLIAGIPFQVEAIMDQVIRQPVSTGIHPDGLHVFDIAVELELLQVLGIDRGQCHAQHKDQYQDAFRHRYL